MKNLHPQMFRADTKQHFKERFLVEVRRATLTRGSIAQQAPCSTATAGKLNHHEAAGLWERSAAAPGTKSRATARHSGAGGVIVGGPGASLRDAAATGDLKTVSEEHELEAQAALPASINELEVQAALPDSIRRLVDEIGEDNNGEPIALRGDLDALSKELNEKLHAHMITALHDVEAGGSAYIYAFQGSVTGPGGRCNERRGLNEVCDVEGKRILLPVMDSSGWGTYHTTNLTEAQDYATRGLFKENQTSVLQQGGQILSAV